MDTFIAIFLFIFSSLYTILLDYIAASPRSLQQALILPTIVLVIEIYSLLRTSREKSYNFYEKWLVIFWGVFFIQLLIICTGGLESPFFILVHLFMIALSLFSSFFISFLFFITTCFVIILDLILHQNLPVFFLKNFNTI